MMQVNLKGTFNCIRAFELNSNSNALNRSIVNFGSIYGMLSPDFRIYSEGDRRSPEMYGVTKAAVLQMTKYFAVDFASKGIRVNSISPGGVFNSQNPQQTEFIQKYCQRTPMGRMATITEVVDACVFLTSNMASYITGHNLIVDGGYSIL
jgi:NAD(P)-dependent dehydrogenase (short-subunit alcohol dehydrogenase family)